MRGGAASAVPFVREMTLRNVPRPLPEKVRDVLPALLADPDDYVLIAVLEAVGDGGDERCRGPLTKLVARTKNARVLAATAGGAQRAGIPRDEYLLMLVDRLAERESRWGAVSVLFETIKEGLGQGECFEFAWSLLTPEEIAAVQEAWRAFIKENGAALRRGERFAASDPAVNPVMLGPGIYEDVPRRLERPPALQGGGQSLPAASRARSAAASAPANPTSLVQP